MGGGPRGADLRRDTLTCPEFRLLERSTHSAEDRFLALTARSQGLETGRTDRLLTLPARDEIAAQAQNIK